MDRDSLAPGFAGRTAIVTGGGSGIGRAAALALAERGMDVLVVGRRPDALAKTAALHAGIRHHVADVTDPDAAGGIVEAAAAKLGRVDVLVNNAGSGAPGGLRQFDIDAAARTWAVNVLGPSLLAHASLPHLLSSEGSIVNVSSTFGAKPAPQVSQYGASKAALEHLTRSWAVELGPHGVRVNAVAPGPTESEALEHMGLTPTEIAAIKARERDSIPLGRRGEPEDVALWVVALADPASWVTGQVIGVDGGYAVV